MAATRVLLLAGKTGPIGVRTVISSLAGVGLTILLVPSLKIDGAALATLLGLTLQHAMLARAAHTVEPTPRPQVRLVLKCVAAVGIACLCAEIPSGAGFIAARAVVTLVCLVLFAAMFLELVAPGRVASMSRLARWMHLAGAPSGV
jgi:O-antigen/teichoic acid export membrane protein